MTRTFMMCTTMLVLLAAPMAAQAQAEKQPAQTAPAQAQPAAPGTETARPPALPCVGAEAVVYFDVGSTTVNADSQSALRDLAGARRGHCTNRIAVTGHADATGSVRRNQQLSLLRAQAVEQQLLALGVPQAEIAVASQGEATPQSTGEQRLNRRVVVALEATPQVALTAPATPTKQPGS